MQVANRLSRLIRRYCTPGGIVRLQKSIARRRESLNYVTLSQGLSNFYLPTKDELLELSQVEHKGSPKISIILPIYNPPLSFLEQAVESVFEQIYSNWELCLVDDASTDMEVISYLDRLEKKDDRVKLARHSQNSHISVTSNKALTLASGDYIALLDQDDKLSPHALHEVVAHINQFPDTDLIYSDEDKIDQKGSHYGVAHKPGFSPEYLLSFMYLGHLSVYRKSFLKELGGFREGFEGAQDYDLALRSIEFTDRVHHIPKVLYHWREHSESVASSSSAKPYAYKAGEKALNDYLTRNKIPLTSHEDSTAKGFYQIKSNKVISGSMAVVTYPANVEVQKSPDSTLGSFGGDTCHLNLCANDYNDLIFNDSKVSLFRILQLADRELDSKVDYLVFHQSHLAIDSIAVKSLSEALLLPSVVASVPKVVRDKKVMLGSVSREGLQIQYHFHGASILESGYGGRLIAMHNISTVPPYVFAIKRSFLTEILESISDCNDLYLDTCLISDYCLNSNRRIVMAPKALALSSKGFLSSTSSLSRSESGGRCQEVLAQLGSFSDPYYNHEIISKLKQFKVIE